MQMRHTRGSGGCRPQGFTCGNKKPLHPPTHLLAALKEVGHEVCRLCAVVGVDVEACKARVGEGGREGGASTRVGGCM